MSSSTCPIRGALALLLCLAQSGCSKKPRDPEAEVRAVIEQAEAAVEAGDLDALQGLMSEDFSDGHGNDRRMVRRMLAVRFLRGRSVHALTVVRQVHIVDPERAQATVMVAVAATPLHGLADLKSVRADALEIELSLSRAGDDPWQIREARWSRASLGSFP